MFPQSMSRPEFRPDDSHADPAHAIEQHIEAGFPPDLALDLVLNELVIQAAEMTHASAAALALFRGEEMVCRAATGQLAPDLGVPLDIRDGLSGACLQTRQPQLSVDTEFDPRVDPIVSQRLGIRSILIVPVFESTDSNARFAGILEVFSTSPAAFSHTEQTTLEGFAAQCARARRAAIDIVGRTPGRALLSLDPPLENEHVFRAPELLPSGFATTDLPLPITPAPRRSPYELWTLLLGALTILAAVGISFLIGSRIGWLKTTASAPAEITQPDASSEAAANANTTPPPSEKRAEEKSTSEKSVSRNLHRAAEKSTRPKAPPPSESSDDLVVYDKGKVIFRLKPTPAEAAATAELERSNNNAESAHAVIPKEPGAHDRSVARSSSPIVPASSTTRIASPRTTWLPPEKAEDRLLNRVEPDYPADALAEHRSGNVVLEVDVAEDGAVSSVRPKSGDPLLTAAAVQAVRNWHYQPFRSHDRPSRFQTEVTLTFSLPN